MNEAAKRHLERTRARAPQVQAFVEATRDAPPITDEQLEAALEQAERDGTDKVRFIVCRKTKPGETIRLYGRSGPPSAADCKIERVAGYNYAAWWYVADLRNHLRAKHHHCHALGCKNSCKPEMLMCRSCWKLVPARTKAAVYAAYRKGQCDDLQVSRAWLLAAETAIAAVAVKQGRMTKDQARVYIDRARQWKGLEGDETPTLDPYALLEHTHADRNADDGEVVPPT